MPWIGTPGLCATFAALGLLTSLGVYRLSLFAHVQFGEFYKALFDQHGSKLDYRGLLAYLADATGDQGLSSLEEREANMAVWRYLRWHKVRLSGKDRNENFEDVVRTRQSRGRPTVVPVHEGKEGGRSQP